MASRSALRPYDCKWGGVGWGGVGQPEGATQCTPAHLGRLMPQVDAQQAEEPAGGLGMRTLMLTGLPLMSG